MAMAMDYAKPVRAPPLLVVDAAAKAKLSKRGVIRDAQPPQSLAPSAASDRVVIRRIYSILQRPRGNRHPFVQFT